MSTLDQPLLIANSNYHVGQQMSIRIAEERGYFREEGLADYLYEWRGLIPGPLEGRGLALVEDGRDVHGRGDVHAVLLHDARQPQVFERPRNEAAMLVDPLLESFLLEELLLLGHADGSLLADVVVAVRDE